MKRPVKIEVFAGGFIVNPSWYVRVRASNGRIMLSSESYPRNNAIRAGKNLHAVIPNSILHVEPKV
jgi:hypothetical protein